MKPFVQSSGVGTWNWVIAFVVAGGIHLLGFLVLPGFEPSAGAVDEGFGGFEVGLGLAQPTIVETPQPPAPPQPEPPEEPPPEQIVEPEPIPEIVPSEIMLPPETEVIREVEPPPVPIMDVTPSVGGNESAVDTPPGTGTVASYGGDVGIQNLFISKVSARLNRFKYYPIKSLRQGEEGIVVLSMVLSRRGRVLAISIGESSGHPKLDQAALKIVNRATPFPRFDRRMKMEELRVNVPMEFAIAKR